MNGIKTFTLAAKILRIASVFALLAVTLAPVTGCTTTSYEATWGVQPERASLVPARTAIIPCRPWPTTARFHSLPLTSLKDGDIRSLCDQFDAYVAEGFKGQPYMRGLSPRLILKVLETEKNPTMLEKGFDTWAGSTPATCNQCTSAPGFYSATIGPRPEWRKWLADFGAIAKSADAVLIPFFMYAYENEHDDRGLLEKRRAAGVALLLVETATGKLIWAGGQEAVATTKELRTASGAKDLAYAPWERVMQRLLVNNIWRDYPGRQEQ
jgi:hypothetical protein